MQRNATSSRPSPFPSLLLSLSPCGSCCRSVRRRVRLFSWVSDKVARFRPFGPSFGLRSCFSPLAHLPLFSPGPSAPHAVALWLRETCGVVGAMVGGVAEYKQQNAVRGLPLELMPEEVTLCLRRGWGVLRRVAADEPPRLLAAGEDEAIPVPAKRSKNADAGPRRWQAAIARSALLAVPMSLEDARSANEEADGDVNGDAGAARLDGGDAGQRGEEGEEEAGRGGRPEAGAVDGATSEADENVRVSAKDMSVDEEVNASNEACAEPSVGREGGASVSVSARTSPRPGSAPPPPSQPAAGLATPGSRPSLPLPLPLPPSWTFPATPSDAARQAIFEDLHARGYRITGGSKFGADFLLYPGDPTLFHAQFGVRCVPPDQPLLPVLLAGTARGTHQARKHLLLASYDREAGGEVAYVTLGPVDGFG